MNYSDQQMSKHIGHLLLNNRVLRSDLATIPAVSAGLYYGAGCFETMLFIGNKIHYLEDHLNRFFKGIEYLTPGSGSKPDRDQLKELLYELIKTNNLDKGSGRIRIQYAVLESSGYRRESDAGSILIGEAKALKVKKDPLKITFTPIATISAKSRPPQLKLSNMLHYREAFQIAEIKGYDDGILLTESGKVAETSIANLFWKKGNTLYTASCSCNILPGIIRNQLVNSIREPYQVVEVEADPEDLLAADSVWVTNSILGVKPVSQIDFTSFETDDELTQYLNTLIL